MPAAHGRCASALRAGGGMQQHSSAWVWGIFSACAVAGMAAGIALPSVPVVALAVLAYAYGAIRQVRAATVIRPARLKQEPSQPEHPHPPVNRVPPVLEPHCVLAALRDAVAHVAPVAAVHLWLVDEATNTLRQVAARGPMAPSSQPVLLEGDDILARAHTTGTADFGEIACVRAGGEACTIWRYALPLTAGDARGVAGVDLRSDIRPETDSLPAATAPVRSSLAGALALHVASIELQTARRLLDASRDLSRILDPHHVLTTALHHAMELSSAETGSIMLIDPKTGKLAIESAEGLPAEVVHSTSVAQGEGIAGWVLASGQPMLIEDLPARTPAARRHGIRSAACVPIADEEGILGVLNVGSRSFPARFTESHLASIEALGKQAATTLRNAHAIEQSRALYFDTLRAFAIALETKDPYSRGGTDRVLEYADAMGAVFGLAGEERHALRVAALLHDIGMASVGEGVLTSDRPLSTVERALLKMHPQLASEILGEVPALRHVVPIVYHHHEWYEGQGYLGGVSGESIPLGARILSVADAFVAMTSPRPYRPAFSEKDALRELEQKAGTQFDPAVVDALKDVLDGGPSRVPGLDRGRA